VTRKSKAVSDAPTILVFDSGLGGLTVFREVAAIRPDAHYVYAADDAAFPYGSWSEGELSDRVTGVMDAMIGRFEPNLIVIACNTASTLVLAELRRRFSLPFVGTVPAIKPACAASKTKLVSVLGTEATVAVEYTKALIRDFGQGCDVTLVGSRRLAVLAEAQLHGETVDIEAIAAEIAPCFVKKNGARTDIVVLACTHYPLLLERLRAAAPWPVTFIDPAPAIARRVTELLGPAGDTRSMPFARIHFTSGKPAPGQLLAAISGFGMQPVPAGAA
jgi:glutamate racemase